MLGSNYAFLICASMNPWLTMIVCSLRALESLQYWRALLARISYPVDQVIMAIKSGYAFTLITLCNYGKLMYT